MDGDRFENYCRSQISEIDAEIVELKSKAEGWTSALSAYLCIRADTARKAPQEEKAQ